MSDYDAMSGSQWLYLWSPNPVSRACNDIPGPKRMEQQTLSALPMAPSKDVEQQESRVKGYFHTVFVVSVAQN